ncbi:DNA polymerase III subunit beta [Candidatus Contubernalis alkaliaceticus]|uniref:DNA polymerase III subunit beta n=1 Tax=Candidatus Contubernalis alkaliaceticus TaxID=338645 RepID=UPI001F4BFEE6|nr:DNA polymerase III subunit beta [Candidatus Contubernalis alkalaceticus]UNC90613.1 DNA polymerase III subunit beta [Candidatus Contubernalis alkalaceticus]
MKFSGNQSELVFYLQACIKIIPQRSTIPSLEGIYITCIGDKLELSATNLEAGIRCSLPVKTEREGAVVLPSKLAEIVRLINDSVINVEVNDTFNALISCNNVNFQLKGLDPLDFPQLPDLDIDFDWTINTHLFKEMIKHTLFCVSGDEGKTALTGIHFSIKENQLTLISSDSFRVSLKKGKIENQRNIETNFIVPVKVLNELIRFKFTEENINIKLDKNNQIIFKVDNFLFFSKLLEEKYPNVERVIPKEFSTSVFVSKNALLDCLQRVLLISQENSFIIKLEICEKKAVFKANSEVGSVEEELEIEKKGEDVVIYLNSKFLIDPLKIITEDKIELNFNKSNGPCIINIIEQQDTYLYLVLPIKS